MAGSSTSPGGGRNELGKNKRKSPPDKAMEPGSTGQRRGSQLWLRLQKGFRHAVEKIMNEELKVAYLSHGLQHLCHISLCHPVRHITHDCRKKVFVVLDTKNNLHFYKENGSFVSSRRAPGAMAGLLYTALSGCFVAWDRDGLQVLDSAFKLLSEVRSAMPIRCGVYSELLNRIVTAGEGNLTIWKFRYGSRTLQRWVTVSDGLGPNDLFCRLALDASGTEPQLCFAACDTGAASFDISSGTLISFKTNLHSRVITGLVYCEVVGSPVTASRDTTIKVWDESWHIRTVFVGHTAPVIALATYPQRPLIFSASQDGTIRTWNLDTVDQVDQVHVSEPVEALETQTESHVTSVSGTSLTLWKINKLYLLYRPLGSPARRLSCIDLRAVADFPVRILCVCQDATVRVLDAPTGSVLAVLSLDPPLQVLDVAYCLPRETLFVLTESGALLRVNAAMDPMVVRKSTTGVCQTSRPTCLLLYSHLVDPQKAYKAWEQVVENKSERKGWQKLPLRLQDKNRYLVIVGQEDGLLSVVDWFSGRVQYQVDAHRSQRVTALAEYPLQTAMVSAGADLTVKMWRVFPYAEESLVLLLCFSCATPACHFCFLGDTLAVAFQDPETVTYSIVYYNLMEQTRVAHGPEDDPLDDIIGLCCCPNLKLFASASRDGSVRVWNIQNQLLRHLKLSTIPQSVAFANPQGDLLVGIDRHLYVIHHNKYLPNYYKMTLLCARFLEPIQNTPLPLSQSCFDLLVQDNVKRLKQDLSSTEDRSSLPSAQQMFPQESKVMSHVQLEAKRSLVPDTGSQDLQQLRMGTVQAAKKARPTKKMREEAFEQYLQIFHEKGPQVEIPEEDVFNADEVLEALCRCESISELYGPNPSNMFLGNFPQPDSLKAARELLKDAKSPGDKVLVAPHTAPVILLPRAKDASHRRLPAEKEEERTWIRTLVSAEAEAEAEGKMLAPPPPEEMKPLLRQKTPPPPLDASPWNLVQKHTFAASADEAKKPPEPPRMHSLAELFLESLFAKSSSGYRRQPRRRLTLISEGDSDSPQLRTLPGSLAGSAVSSRVDVARSWKEPEGLPPPRDSPGFIPNSVAAQQLHVFDSGSVERLVRVIQAEEEPGSPSTVSLTKMPVPDEGLEREPPEKRLDSISGPSTQKESSKIFLTQLDESHYPEPRTQAEEEEEVADIFLPFRNADWFEQVFPEGFPPGMGLDEFLARLLVAMATADFKTKMKLLKAILSLREVLGPGMSEMVHDTLIYFLNMKNEAPSLQGETQARFILSALRALVILDRDSKDLMVELMTYYLAASSAFRLFIERLIQETGVQDPHSYFYMEMNSWKVQRETPKAELRRICSLWLEGAMEELQAHKALALKHKAHPEGRHLWKHHGKAKVTSPRWADSHPVHPVDAINYFVEKQLEQELNELKQAELEEKRREGLKRVPSRPGQMPKTSVMALPPIQKDRAILRLGETNAMLRNRIPEYFYFPHIFPRYLLKGFVPFVKLPLPRINLEPFPSDSGRLDSPETFTAKQQLVQKYFFPKFSYADSYP